MNRNPNNNNKAESLFNPHPGNKEDVNNIPAAPTNPPRPAKDEDIEKLMKLAKCTHAEARAALYNNAHRVYDALRSLWKIVADPEEPPSEAFVTPTKPIASTRKTSDPRSSQKTPARRYTDEERRERRKESNRKAQKKRRDEAREAKEENQRLRQIIDRASPAIKKERMLDNYTRAIDRHSDRLGDLSDLTKDVYATIE